MIHLDSHIVIWTRANRSRLSGTARRLLEDEHCLVSPAVLLEVDGLFELGRIPFDAATAFESLGSQTRLSVADTPFLDVVNAARSFAWTHEPFDRLIVGAAMAEGVRLLTADATILQHFADAVW